MYIARVIPEHVKDPRAPVDKSRVLIPGVTGQILELLRIAVKLHRKQLSLNVRRCVIDFGLGYLRLRQGAVCSLIVHIVCIDFSYRWLACVPLYLANS